MKRNPYLIAFLILSTSFVARAWAPNRILDASEIYERARKSVVVVKCARQDNRVVLGSGVVLRSDGVIATNFHVCGEATAAQIKLPNGDIYDDVSISDSDEQKDIAILKIKANGLPALPMGDSDKLKIGASVFAVGAPLGLEGSITSGIISSIRPVDEMFSWAEGFRIIQISAPISHGSSGGPLLDGYGNVIGLVFAQKQEGENLNAAIPINYILPLVNTTKEAVALKRLPSEKLGRVVTNPAAARARTLDNIAGVYVGQWVSDRHDIGGNLAMTVTVANGVAKITLVFTGSEYFDQDELTANVTPMGTGVWKMDYVGKRSKMKGTGLLMNGRFVGDYKVKKFIRTDVGNWEVDISP
jgi:S1-C subfamily serine protease